VSEGTITFKKHTIEANVLIEESADADIIRQAIETIEGDNAKIFIDCAAVGARALMGLATGNEVQHLREVLDITRAEAIKINEVICKELVKAAEAAGERVTEQVEELAEAFDELAKDNATLDEIKAMLDPGNDDSPVAALLNRIRRIARETMTDVATDSAKSQQEHLEAQDELLEDLREATEKMAAWISRSEEALRGTRQGHAFEGEIEEILGEIARMLAGAILEDVSCEAGNIPNCKTGDHVLDVDGVRIVFEEKNEKKAMTVARARTLGEQACENRDADVCVVVVASMDHVPGKQPFAIIDSTLAVVDGSVAYTLQLVVRYLLQVAQLRQDGGTDGDIAALTEHVGELLERMTGRLRHLKTMRSCVSKSQAGLDGITTAITKMESELKADLAELEDRLADYGEDEPLAA